MHACIGIYLSIKKRYFFLRRYATKAFLRTYNRSIHTHSLPNVGQYFSGFYVTLQSASVDAISSMPEVTTPVIIRLPSRSINFSRVSRRLSFLLDTSGELPLARADQPVLLRYARLRHEIYKTDLYLALNDVDQKNAASIITQLKPADSPLNYFNVTSFDASTITWAHGQPPATTDTGSG